MSDLRQSRFTPGPGTAIVTRDAVALVGARSDSPTCVAIETALAGGGGLERVMTALSALGFVELPGFAVAVAVADGVQLLHRGNLTAQLRDSNDEVHHFVAPRVTGWREEFIADAVSVRASIEDFDATGIYWVSAGVVPARSIEWSVPADVIGQESAKNWATPRPEVAPEGLIDTKSPQAPTPQTVPEDGLAVGASFDPPSPADSSLLLDAVSRASEAKAEPLREPVAPSVFGALVVAPSAAEIDGGELPAEPFPGTHLPEAQPGSAAPVSLDPIESVGSAPMAVDDVDFGNFLHHTVFRSAEDAAIRPTADDEVVASAPPVPNLAGSSSGETLAPEWTRHSVNPPVADPAGGESGNDSLIISSIPQPGRPVSASSSATDGDHDGHTVARPRRREGVAQGQRVQPSATHGRPMVSAVACSLGHFSPPHAHQCRICAQAIVDRAQILTPRPALAMFRFSTNAVATVTGPLLIGRNPPSGQIIDNEVATILAIDNAELSRFHAAIYVTEWYVYIADQGSVNGTVVKVPGKDPQTLRPNERVQISQGTVVELGGAVDFRFDVA